MKEKRTRLSEQISSLVKIVGPPANDEIFILPDRVVEQDGKAFAAFRPETQALRVLFQDAGFKVKLLAPEGAKRGGYEEHDDSWVLPVVLTAAGLPIGILSSLVADWIKSKARSKDSPRVLYRHATIETAEADIDLVEISGTAEEIAQLLASRDDTSKTD
jgi:hypothetical protein